MNRTRITDIPDPQGGRNRLRAGDPVRICAGPVDATGFRATFHSADLDEYGTIVALTVFGGRGYVPGLPFAKQTGVCEWRTFDPARVSRMAVATQARKVAA